MAYKVLMATMGLDIGGAETHIVELSRELNRRGVEVIIASAGGVYVEEIEACGIRHYTVPLNTRSIKDMLRSRRLLKKIIKTEKPNVVHAHARIPAFVCGSLHKTMRFPFITTAHWVFDASGSLKYLTNWGQKTIAVSEDIKQYLMDSYKTPEENISVTINGIDTEKFSPEVSGLPVRNEFGIHEGHPVIAHVSRLDESRALVARQLIEIAPELSDSVKNVHLLIAGGGDKYEELLAMAESANAQAGYNLVIMTGPRNDINKIVAAGDVFVGVSRAALEAMAASKPVIVAGNEGYLGIYEKSKAEQAKASNFCCRDCEMSAPELLKRDLLLCFTGKVSFSSLGNDGRELIKSDYSVKKMADDCEAVYNLVRTYKYNVVMSGYYGFGNAGDEAILQSIYRNIIASGNGDISITVLSRNPEYTRIRYGYTAIDRFDIFRVIKALRKCDALVSGGGSLLQDYTSTRSLIYYLSIIKAAKFFGKKVMVYANGIGPVTKTSNRKRVCKVINSADIVTLRDFSSKKELISMGVTRDDLLVTADPVFTFDSISKGDVPALLEKLNIKAPFIGISVRSQNDSLRNWNCSSLFCQEMAKLCDALYEKYNRSIVFIVMQTTNDAYLSSMVQKNMTHPSIILDMNILEDGFSSQELMGVIGAADAVLAMRLHTLIFAARMCVPLAGITYDPKVMAYMDMLNMPEVGVPDNFSAEKALPIVSDLIENRQKYVDILNVKSRELEASARINSKMFIELLEK